MGYKNTKEYLQRRISPNESYDDLLSFPRFIEIETVNACNARCPMCTIDDWQRNTPTMKDDLFRRIADEIIDHRHEVNRVSLYRDGEPLLFFGGQYKTSKPCGLLERWRRQRNVNQHECFAFERRTFPRAS